MKIPGTDHPISIEPHEGTLRITVDGVVVAETKHALALREASYPVVFYIPRTDTRMELLERTAHTTHCPYKGDASYFSIPSGGERSHNAVWSYETPFPAVAAIQDHLAFYPNRVGSIEIE
jgi:uncharacterized protein (DUF427 family)